MMSDKINPDWLKWPICQGSLQALGHDNLRFVGGCVRDTLVGRPIKDVDACTPLLPDDAMERLSEAGIKVIPTGIDHGTITALLEDQTIEITTLRRDVTAINSRHAEVAFTDDWAVDARRRDLTMNALYMDGEGRIYDPVDGLKDLKSGHIRFIGNPHERITEDALRILRFFRFYAWYGRGVMDEEALKASSELKDKTKVLSTERIRDELLKLLLAPNPMPVLKEMDAIGLLPLVLGDDYNLSRLDTVIEREAEISSPDALCRLIALCGIDMDVAKMLTHKFHLSGRQKKSMMAMVQASFLFDNDVDNSELRTVFHYGKNDTLNGLKVSNNSELVDILNVINDMEEPNFPLKGSDVIANGIEAGPKVGQALTVLTEAWLASGATLTKQDLLNQVKGL